jgi:serine-type D-Ala-D-Ala carboxypeptidase
LFSFLVVVFCLALAMLLLLLFLAAVGCTASSPSPDHEDYAPYANQYDWAPIDTLLEAQIANHSFPACVAAIANEDGLLYFRALGNFTYGEHPPFNDDNPAVVNNSMFDMASLTKVLMTTTAVMTFYQRGELDLDTPVSDPYLLGPDYAVNGKATVTVRNLLLHNAGLPPDPTPYWYYQTEFGCPGSSDYFPPEDFACQQKIYQAVLDQTLINPVGAVYVYSDLSMITMMYIVGTLARDLGYITVNDLRSSCIEGKPSEWFKPRSLEDDGLMHPINTGVEQCYYLAYVKKFVIEHAGMTKSMFLVDPLMYDECVPTWNDTTGYAPTPSGYRHRVMQGQVSDENAYAMGGVSGHAGFFSTGMDVFHLLQKIMFATPDNNWVNSTTMNLFTTIYNVTQSSRALGWDTNNYLMNTYRGCGNFSQNTFTHTGYTGTQVCNDKDRQLIAVLLTNRVYPVANNASENAIHEARILFSNAILDVYDNTAID